MSAEAIWTVDGLRVEVYGSARDASAAAARSAVEVLSRAIEARGKAVMISATGQAMKWFAESLPTAGPVDWGQVTLFHLDEVVADPAAGGYVLSEWAREHLVRKLGIGVFHAISGNPDGVDAELVRYGSLLRKTQIDLAVVGVGENCHIAFNEPPADFATDAPAIRIRLADTTRKYLFKLGYYKNMIDVPTHGITLSVPEIMRANHVIAVVPEARKAEAIRRLLEEPVDPQIPASPLRNHPDSHLFLDRDSSARVDTPTL